MHVQLAGLPVVDRLRARTFRAGCFACHVVADKSLLQDSDGNRRLVVKGESR